MYSAECPVCRLTIENEYGPVAAVLEHFTVEHAPLAAFLNEAMRTTSLTWWRVGLHTPVEQPTAGWVSS